MKGRVGFSVLLALVIAGLALGPFLALTGCELFGDCSDATSSLRECEDCVGIEHRSDGSVWTPCEHFEFTEGETCECEYF
jgi:hypothetical protein